MKIAGFVTIRFTERTDGSRERESRLYPTREEAEAARKKVLAERNANDFR